MRELSIGQMSELNCVSEKTLRLYHEKGLLVPYRIDPNTGYRYYSISQCATLDMIQQMQVLGFSLEQIQVIAKKQDVDYLEALVSEQLDVIEKRLQEMIAAKRIGETALHNCHIYNNRPICHEVMMENLPERKILRFGIANPEMKRTDITGAEAMEEWEITLRYIKKEMIERGIPLSLFRNVGCMVYQENLMKRDIHIDDSFVFLKRSYGELFDTAEVMPSGQYLTMYCESFVSNTGEYAEFIDINKLLDHAEDKGYEVAGHYYGEIIAETPAFPLEGRDSFFKLHIPVKQKLKR